MYNQSSLTPLIVAASILSEDFEGSSKFSEDDIRNLLALLWRGNL